VLLLTERVCHVAGRNSNENEGERRRKKISENVHQFAAGDETSDIRGAKLEYQSISHAKFELVNLILIFRYVSTSS
jgi:hypothetical protein